MNDSNQHKLIISGFADEASSSKDLDQQFSVVAALGMQFFSIRFVSINGNIKNAVDLSNDELSIVNSKMEDYGLRVSSLGSPLGKVKLCDVEDGTPNQFVPFDKYLTNNVNRACEVAVQLNTRLIRGFSFYHPRESDVAAHINQAVEQIGRMVETVASFDLILGLEVEANLVGHSGEILAEIYQRINHPNLVLIFDGANLVTQGFDTEQVFQQYLAMKPGLGWLHVKDYERDDTLQSGNYVDEDALRRYVPVENGDSAYWRIFQDLLNDGQQLFARCEHLGLPGLFLDLEPHLKGGGQFGGFSDADGFGLAFRSLSHLLELIGLPFELRDLESVKSSMKRSS